MSFTSSFEKLRMIGRKAVLPTDRIKTIVMEEITDITDGIVDLGAGTKYWSEWLFNTYQKNVFAIDTFYERKKSVYGVSQYEDYFECIVSENICMLWCCDVVHHLETGFRERVIESIGNVKYDYVVIKDIDCRRRFGNFCNRIHDYVINHEHVVDVNPESLIEVLKKQGYHTVYNYIPKLWYPHFIIIAKKND